MLARNPFDGGSAGLSKDQKLELLAGVPLFDQLGKNELLRVGELADLMDLPSGRTVIRQGETGAEALVMVEGSASIERDGERVDVIGPGAVVGEMALLSSQPRNATVTLTGDSELLVLGRREFQALMNEMPSVRSQIMECLAMRLIASEDSTSL
jgi:CRP-like cAMP-binding protein